MKGYKFYRNNKNGEEYTLVNIVTDVTNGSTRKDYAYYFDSSGECYIRELNEFHNKFTQI